MSGSFFNSFGEVKQPVSNFGTWVLAADFACPSGGGSGSQIPFSPQVEGSLPGFDVPTKTFTVLKNGIYSISWFGTLSVADPGGGIKRESVIDYQKVIPDITNDPIVTHPVVSGQFSSFGVSLTLPTPRL